MGGVALFGLDPGFLMLGQIGIMGEVGMGGVGSSTMELIGGALLRVFTSSSRTEWARALPGRRFLLSPWG